MGEARIVRSGHFRIDPRRALEKLRRFRFAHPAIFLDEWVRCAVVSGASRVRIEPRRGELAILFDGRPLSKPELEDPWSAALEGEGRARDLALGLVAVLALEPAGVRVQSGGLCLAVDGLGPVSLSEAPRERDSRIVIEWSAGRADESWRARIKDAERFALAACELESPAGPLSKPRPGAQALAFERGGLRGWIEPRRVDATPQSVVRVFRCGVLVEALGHPQGSAPGFAGAAVSAWVNDDRAETDASLERLRRDSPRLRGLSRLLERRTRDLGAAVGRWHAPRFERAAALLQRPDCLRSWSERAGFPPTADDFDRSFDEVRAAAAARLPGLGPEELRDFVVAGWAADWLHRGGFPEARFFAGAGKTAGAAELEEERSRLGVVRWSRAAGAAPVWCPGVREIGWVTHRFGGATRET